QRSVSLEKKKLQGLLDEAKGASGGGGGGGVVLPTLPTQDNIEVAKGAACEAGGGGVAGGDGGGVVGMPVATTGTDAAGDPRVDDAAKEEGGSLGSGDSMEAVGGDLPGLEDFWGTSFEEDKPAETVPGRKAGMFGSIGDNRGAVGGDAGSGRGVVWASGEDLEVPEEAAVDALKLVEENGPWVYELFAVLIHSGSALGGHYYAHIKSLGDDAGWFTFNDSRVTPTDEDDVKRAWGGRWGQSSTWRQRRAAAATAAAAAAAAAAANAARANGGVRGASAAGTGAGGEEASSQQQARPPPPPPPPPPPKWGNSAANAYMLMYRRVDPAENRRHVQREEVPEHVARQVREHARKAAEAEAAAAAAREALACAVTVKAVLNGGPAERTVKGDKRRPLRELVDRIAEAFGIPAVAGAAKDGCSGDTELSHKGETEAETQDGGRGDGACTPAGEETGAEQKDWIEVNGRGGDKIETGGESITAGGEAAAATGEESRRAPVRLVRLREYLAGPRLAGAALDDECSPAELFFGSHEK
ncbi:unnamed protein product, partial [Hapterophycus canaliculatus]